MTEKIKRKVSSKSIRLSSHDINVVSVIAQQTSLPHDFLLKYAKGSNISSDAYLVVKSLLNESSSSSAAKKSKHSLPNEVATDFRKWAVKMK